MSKTPHFDWVDFYMEFARKLLPYKANRQELVAKVRRIFEITGSNLPTLGKGHQIMDIDPFTVFGLFNKNTLKQSSREKMLSAVAELFHVVSPVPTSFDGIPVLNSLNATFYHFGGGHEEGDMDDLWVFFESALAYAKNATPENRSRLSKYFDLVINRKGNANSKITMGLFWIAPNSFLNLDSRNTWYIYDSGMIPEGFVQALPKIEKKVPSQKYFDIVEKLRTYLQSDASTCKDFKELSFEAWRYSEEVNKEIRAKKAQEERESRGVAMGDEDVETVRYWIFSPGENATFWDEFYDAGIMAIGSDPLGDLKAYRSKDEMKRKMQETIDPRKSYINDAHATWQFANEMKPGDIVFAKKGMRLVVGRGIVESDYEYDPTREHYKNVRQVKWTHKGEWQHPGQAVVKTLTDITSYTDYVGKLNALFESDMSDAEEPEIEYPPYNAENFLEEVFMDVESYENLVTLVRTKKNVILQGPPGVGKTFTAKRLAYSMMGVKDQERVMMVQFHQSYSYEDFIMGFRPSENRFELKRGTFYNFCKAAEIDGENEFFFIIDEINRGNLSKIFGELFMLIENDKRGVEMQLLYSDEKFCIPQNVHIIGTMNTADRSLAMLDYALRRRFAFFEMQPGFETDGFREYQMGLNSPKFDSLIHWVEDLNEKIAGDASLGEGFRIGHSFFCHLSEVTDQDLSQIVEYEIIPLLKEYWFDDPGKVKNWVSNLRSALR